MDAAGVILQSVVHEVPPVLGYPLKPSGPR